MPAHVFERAGTTHEIGLGSKLVLTDRYADYLEQEGGFGYPQPLGEGLFSPSFVGTVETIMCVFLTGKGALSPVLDHRSTAQRLGKVAFHKQQVILAGQFNLTNSC